MTINRENGESVYLQDRPHFEKRNEPLYLSTRELIRRLLPNPDSGMVLDIGCSDLVATGSLLEEGYKIIGVDLDPTSVKKASETYPNALLAVANIKEIPFSLNDEVPKVVVLLDIIEHLDYDDAVAALVQLKSKMGGSFKLIISMPNISLFSKATVKEGMNVIANRQKPATGLFDRTHKIFTDIEGHRNLFTEAGYEITDEFVTNWEEGVTGNDWEWKSDFKSTSTRLERSKKYRAYKLFEKLGVTFLTRVKKLDWSTAEKTVTGYQGLYVLSPKNDNEN